MRKFAIMAAVAALGLSAATTQAAVILADFNINQGTFTSPPTNGSGVPSSGSTTGIAGASTLARVTSTSAEGVGSQEMTFSTTAASARLRHTSGGGTPANNTPFATTSGADGWIGAYIKTSSTGWNLQIYMEPAATGGATGSNGSIPKNIIADGAWHLYEWNLDDNAGDADGWGTISGIVAGVATVGNGNHTIDSLVFRNAAATIGAQDIFFDFLAINPNGSVADLVTSPEPASFSLLALGAAPLLRRRRA